jgi:hypothetical protein
MLLSKLHATMRTHGTHGHRHTTSRTTAARTITGDSSHPRASAVPFRAATASVRSCSICEYRWAWSAAGGGGGGAAILSAINGAPARGRELRWRAAHSSQK